MGHRGIRSEDSLEFRAAKAFCLENSKYDRKLSESIFLGCPEEVAAYVKLVVADVFMADVPDTPQGLVVTDNHGNGAFQ